MGCVPNKNKITFVYQKPKISNNLSYYPQKIKRREINCTSTEDTDNNLILFSVCEDDGQSCDSNIRKQVGLIEKENFSCKCT